MGGLPRRRAEYRALDPALTEGPFLVRHRAIDTREVSDVRF